MGLFKRHYANQIFVLTFVSSSSDKHSATAVVMVIWRVLVLVVAGAGARERLLDSVQLQRGDQVGRDWWRRVT